LEAIKKYEVLIQAIINLIINYKFERMKKNRFAIGLLALFAMASLALVSCKDEADPPVPDFSSVIVDKTVTFTNLSTNATSYSWDFGDGSVLSTETNPVYTYAAYGDYDVRLTATGEGGSVIKKITISVVKVWPVITIDGSFADWAAVPSFYSGYGEDGGSLTEAKITSNAATSKLYIYIKGDLSAANQVIQTIINADGDTATGWRTANNATNRLASSGAEYQFEYYIFDLWGGTYSWNPDPGVQDWPWDIDITSGANGDITESSGVIGDAEIEFVIETSLMKNPVPASKIGIFFWAQNTDWNQVGQLPPVDKDPLMEVKMFNFQ
jgi:PKD repeat protein